MASTSSEKNYEAAIQTLVDHLQRGFNDTKLVEVPSKLWEPFTRSAEPATSRALRPLADLFGGKYALYPFKLSPQAFPYLISIVSYASDSAVQQRLLRTFISCLRRWKDDNAALAALKQCKVDDVDSDRLLQLRDTLTQNLVTSTVRTLKNDRLSLRAKCAAAEILTTVVRGNPKAQTYMTTTSDCTVLGLIIRDHDDYVLRFLIADALRELLFGGADRKSCWPAGSAPDLIKLFPIDQHTTPEWLSRVQDYLSDFDKSKAFAEPRQSVFRATQCVHWKDDGTLSDGKAVGDILMVFSDQINCLIPDREHSLVLAEYPIFPQEIMSVKHIPSSEGESPTLIVEYLEDKGFEVMDGTRAAVRGLKFGLMSAEDATTVSEVLQILQKEAGKPSPTNSLSHHADATMEEADQKRSVAIIDLESPRRDHSTAESHHGHAADQSDTQTMTPLERKAKPRLVGPEISSLLDQFLMPDVSEDKVHRPLASFKERLRASQEPRSKDLLDQGPTAQLGPSKKRGLADLESINPAQSSFSKSANQAGPSTTAPSHAASSTGSRLKQPQKTKAAPTESSRARGQDLPIASKATSQEPTSPEPDHAAARPRATGPGLPKISGKDATKSKWSQSATADGESQLNRLKRSKSASWTSHKEDIDWDEGLRDGQEYDLPGDDDNENNTAQTRPKKKARTEPKKTSGKVASTSTSKTASDSRFKIPKLPAQSKSKLTKKKTNGSAKTAVTVEPTLATSRSRRVQQTRVYDESEDSDSQISSPGESHSSSQRALVESQPRLKATHIRGKKSGEVKVAKGSVNSARSTFKNNSKQGKEQEESQVIGSSKAVPIEFSDDSSPAPGQSPDPKPRRQASNEANEVAQSAAAAALVADDAQDSHPLAKADVDAFVASAKNDFESQLKDYVDELRPASTGKRSRLPDPAAPFGGKAQFVANVNASISKTSRGQRQSSRASKPSVAVVSQADQLMGNAETVIMGRITSPMAPLEPQGTMNLKSPVSAKSVPEVTQAFIDNESESLTAEVADYEQGDENLLRPGHQVAVSQHEQTSEKMRQPEAEADTLAQSTSVIRIRKPDTDTTKAFEVDRTMENTSTQLTAANLKRHQEPQGDEQPSQLAKQAEAPVGVSAAATSHPGSGPDKGKPIGPGVGTLPLNLVGRANVLTRPVAKSSSEGLSKTNGTPSAGLKGQRLSDFTPTTEKAMSRTPVIHFSKTGPKNQGLSTGLPSAPRSKASGVPRQEFSHEAFKRSAARESLPVERTPSYDSGKINLEPEAKADQTEPAEVYVEKHQPSNKENIHRYNIVTSNEFDDLVDEAHDEASIDEAFDVDQDFTTETDWDEGVAPTNSPPLAEVDSEGATDARRSSEGPTASDSLSDTMPEVVAQKSSSPRDRSEGAMAPHEQPDLKALHAEQAYAVSANMPVAGVLDSHQNIIPGDKTALQSRSVAAFQDGEKSSRRSIGIGGLTSRTFPAAQPVIKTASFRAQTRDKQLKAGRSTTHTPAENIVNPLRPSHGIVTTAIKSPAARVVDSEVTAKRAQTVDAVPYKAMPPPPPKAPASRKLATPATYVAKQPRTSILKQKPVDESHATTNTREPVSITSSHHVPTNCDASVAWSDDRPEVLGGTPQPFHTKLEKDIKQADEARARREASTYLTEDSNDRTIVNDDSRYSGIFLGRPLFKSFCETTASKNGNSSIGDDEDATRYVHDQAAWRSEIRGSHRGLLDVVMQVTKDVLFRLGEEEDAISAKQSDFDRGGELVISKLAKSWNERLEREQGQLVEALRERSASLGKAAMKKGLFDHGTMTAGSVLMEADVLPSTQGLQEKPMLTDKMLESLLEKLKEASTDNAKGKTA